MTTTGMENTEMSQDQGTYDATETDDGKWGALRMIGLLALLAAFAGFVYLAYMQGVRNGSVGAPPMIRADNTPFKIPPQNPGGTQFENTEKIIYDRVDGDTATPPSAPQVAEAATPAKPKVVQAASADDLVSHPKSPLVVAGTETPAQGSDIRLITDPRLDGIGAAIQRADSLGRGGPINESEELLPQESDNAPAAANKPVQKTASSPAGSGTTGATTAAPVAATPAPTAQTVATAPAPTPTAPVAAKSAGAYVVQIASYRDKPAAEDAWSKFNAKFSDVTPGLGPDFQTADVPGKGTFVRLRVGPFDNKDQANTLCQTLKSRSQGCLVVKI